MTYACCNCGWVSKSNGSLLCGHSDKLVYETGCCMAWIPQDNYSSYNYGDFKAEPKTPTNADHIHTMSDEELAQFMEDVHTFKGCPNQGLIDCRESCYQCWLSWLKQEKKDE